MLLYKSVILFCASTNFKHNIIMNELTLFLLKFWSIFIYLQFKYVIYFFWSKCVIHLKADKVLKSKIFSMRISIGTSKFTNLTSYTLYTSFLLLNTNVCSLDLLLNS